MSSVLIYNVENNKSKENTSQKKERCVQTFDWYCTWIANDRAGTGPDQLSKYIPHPTTGTHVFEEELAWQGGEPTGFPLLTNHDT